MALGRMRGMYSRAITRVKKVTPPGMKKALSNYKWIAYISGGLLIWLMVKGVLNPTIIKDSFTGKKPAPQLPPTGEAGE